MATAKVCAEVERVDALIAQMDVAYKKVLEVQGTPVKLPSAELNLLTILGQLRDTLLRSLRCHDRELLAELFGGSCHRVARIKALLDILEFSPMNASDQRLRGCSNACASVREVLIDMGLAVVLQKAEDREKVAILTAAFQEEPATAAETAHETEEPAAAADELCAAAGLRPALGAVVEEEWAELMGVLTCKVGCGRRTSPGLTRSGKAFDTCCRGCAMGRAHHKLCGLIDPAMVGKGLCKNGCGRQAAEGTDSYDRRRDTCCRGCANGEHHDDWCSTAGALGSDDGAKHPAHDERSFFTEVKSSLAAAEFGAFLEQCRLLSAKRQTLAETVEKVGALFGKEQAAQLKDDFERLAGQALKKAALEK